MHYLTDYRADLRASPSALLPGARSVICVAFPCNGPEPYSTEFSDSERGWIARYAWGEDYHSRVRQKLEELAAKLMVLCQFNWRACVDTAPLLERSLAQAAGLGWIGRNTCLINQKMGSFFFSANCLQLSKLRPTRRHLIAADHALDASMPARPRRSFPPPMADSSSIRGFAFRISRSSSAAGFPSSIAPKWETTSLDAISARMFVPGTEKRPEPKTGR